jgi:cobalamin biosynthesis Mg chelatase CobN
MKQSPSLKQVLKAVAGALIGVQSEQQRQQDFNSSSPMPYIVVGIIVTALFVLTLLLIVSTVLS